MSNAIGNAQKVSPRIEVPLRSDTHTEEYANLLLGRDRRKIAFARIGEALAVIVVPVHGGRLFSRLTKGRHGDFNSELKGLPLVAAQLVRRGSHHNSLIIETLQYDREGQPYLMPGAVPMFWWLRVEPKTIRSLLLYEAIALTVYNPAHFFARLEGDGFVVRPSGSHPADYIVEKRIGNRLLRLENIGYYLALASRYLWRDDALIDLVVSGVRHIGGIRGSGRVELRFEHLMWPPRGVEADAGAGDPGVEQDRLETGASG